MSGPPPVSAAELALAAYASLRAMIRDLVWAANLRGLFHTVHIRGYTWCAVGWRCTCSLPKLCVFRSCTCTRPRGCVERACACSRIHVCTSTACDCGAQRARTSDHALARLFLS